MFQIQIPAGIPSTFHQIMRDFAMDNIQKGAIWGLVAGLILGLLIASQLKKQ